MLFCDRVVDPAHLYRRPDSLDVLFVVVSIQLRCFGVCGTIKMDASVSTLCDNSEDKSGLRVWIRIVQQTLDTRQDRRYVVRRTPTILQDIETEFTVRVDVRVKHL